MPRRKVNTTSRGSRQEASPAQDPHAIMALAGSSSMYPGNGSLQEDADSDQDMDSEEEAFDYGGGMEQFSEIDSGEEWQLGNASDPGDEEDEEMAQAGPSRNFLPPLQPANQFDPSLLDSQPANQFAEPPAGPFGPIQPSRFSRAQEQRLIEDAMGPESWRETAGQLRQREAAGDDPDEDEDVDEEDLGSFVRNLTGGSSMTQLSSSMPSAPGRSGSVDREVFDPEGFEKELYAASGFKKPKKRMLPRGRKAPALPKEATDLLSQANIAYVNADLHEAIEKLTEVIRIAPWSVGAFTRLATCYGELGEIDRELSARIIVARLTPRALDQWIDIARRSEEHGFTQQAIFCLEQAIKLSREKDKSDVIDAMWDRANLLQSMNDYVKATSALQGILRVRPHNAEVLNHLIPVLLTRGKHTKAIELLEGCRDHFVETFPDPTTNDGIRFNGYRGSEMATLCDLLLNNGEPTSALHVIRQGARWLQGRANETFWDDVLEDDREFDDTRDGVREGVVEYGRRVDLAPVYEPLDIQLRLRLGKARALMGDFEESARHYDIFVASTDPIDEADRYDEIINHDIEQGHYDHAMSILERMIDIEVLQVPALYVKVGICQLHLGDAVHAASCFEAVLQHNTEDLDTKLLLAEAYNQSGRRSEAAQMAGEVYQAQQRAILAEMGDDGTAAGLSEQDPSTMMLFDDVQASGRGSGTKGRSRKPLKADARDRLEKARELEAAEYLRRLKNREDEVFCDGWWRSDLLIGLPAGQTLSDVRPRYGIDDGRENESDTARRFAATREWLEVAGRLVHSFRSQAQLFPRGRRIGRGQPGAASKPPRVFSRRGGANRSAGEGKSDLGSQATELLSRIRDGIMDESNVNDESSAEAWQLATYRGLTMDEWIELILKYAFVLVKVGEEKTAFEVLEHIQSSSFVTMSDSRRCALGLGYVACGLYVRDYVKVFEGIRFLPFKYQFTTAPLRILSCVAHACGFYGLDAFSEPRFTKMMVRRQRTHEAMVNGKSFRWSGTQGRYIVLDKLIKRRVGLRARAKGGGRAARVVGRYSKQFNEEGEEDEDEDEDAEEQQGDGDDDDEEDGNSIAGDTTADHNDGDTTMMSSQSAPQDPSTSSGLNPGVTPPTKINPLGEAFYAYYLLVAGSYQAALGYTLRAHAHLSCDALLCLVLSVAALGRLTNRQVDNRGHLLLQGISFAKMYKSLRGGSQRDAEGREVRNKAWREGTYNLGRALHSVGLFQMAVPLYESVLSSVSLDDHEAKSAEEQDTTPPTPPTAGFDCIEEAAYNLSLIYGINGDVRGARNLMERYLVIEG